MSFSKHKRTITQKKGKESSFNSSNNTLPYAIIFLISAMKEKSMKPLKNLVILSLFLTAPTWAAKPTVTFDFESEQLSGPPVSWECSPIWQVENKADAPSGKQVLSMVKHTQRRPFNTCYTPKTVFKDGTVTVHFRANRGRIDRGGGIMWRVQDARNYYVARFNPLEDNFRFYKVIDGRRSELASADVTLSAGWHTMKIVQKGDRFEGWLDGKRLLAATDRSLRKPGSVGVWTKADAATSFDNLTVRILHEK